ncbi:MAG: hypothetical protein GY925_23590, partial [Actinomycetia bacterium]|nr:hypothetical protein [Actinomycetes bacterium]
MHTGGFGDGDLYALTRFALTAKDGTIYILDTTDGLIEATDRNANTVTVDAAGVHSSLGPEIVFGRDTEGRITTITDPTGGVIAYTYDTTGDLVSVTDQNANVTAFTYLPGHYLDEI